MRDEEYPHHISLDWIVHGTEDTLLAFFFNFAVLFPTIWWHIKNMPEEVMLFLQPFRKQAVILLCISI